MCCFSAWPLLCGIQTACRSRHYCKLQAIPQSERSPARNLSLNVQRKRERELVICVTVYYCHLSSPALSIQCRLSKPHKTKQLQNLALLMCLIYYTIILRFGLFVIQTATQTQTALLWQEIADVAPSSGHKHNSPHYATVLSNHQAEFMRVLMCCWRRDVQWNYCILSAF